MSFFRPIHHIFAPHADARHCLRAASLLARPWQWQNGAALTALRMQLQEHLNGDVSLFSNGREALLALFRAINIGPGDEILVQAYTCVVVVNAIRAAGATPVFVDIEKANLSMDLNDASRLITPKTKAVLCQHTFGLPAPLAELKALCDQHHIPLLEDCAHILPDDAGPADIGRMGEFALLSFGRDKAVSGVTGGAIVSRRTDVTHRLRTFEESAPLISSATIARYLCYPLLYALARPLYGLFLGKVLLKLAAMIGLLPAIVTAEERKGHQSHVVHRLPNACAALALDGLDRLHAINDHRRALTRFYLEACAEHGWPVLHGISPDLPLQKFPIFFPNAERLRRTLKSKNIHLHDGWTGCVICPATVDAEAVGYRDGEDPKAEECGEQILSLPTHPTMSMENAKYLIAMLQRFQPAPRTGSPETRIQ